MMQVSGLPTRDSIRAVVREVTAAPEYAWEERRSPLALVSELLDRIVRWMETMQQAHPVVYWTLVGFLTGLLLAILVHVSLAVWRSVRPRATTRRPSEVMPRGQHTVAWHLEAWRRRRSEGRYAEALAHRFAALVLELDRQKAVSFHPAKTPHEYTREARLDEAGRASLAQLATTLYGHLFGRAPCTLEDLERFDRQAGRVGGTVAA